MKKIKFLSVALLLGFFANTSSAVESSNQGRKSKRPATALCEEAFKFVKWGMPIINNHFNNF
ncbi:MAG: hypothetical protein FJX00_01600 [Alphaproteobacteria bacterium]|nr:hypothetical protein [Alphaproteobacteria bacterium]